MTVAGRPTALRPLVARGEGSGAPRHVIRTAASATPPTVSKVVAARGMCPAFVGLTENRLLLT